MTSVSCKTKVKSEATKFLKDFKFDHTPKPEIDKSQLKLSELQERILSHYKLNNSHHTFLSYRNSYNNFIRIVGDKPISMVGKSEMEDFKSKRSSEVNQISTNIDIRNIKAMFNKLVEFEFLRIL